MTTGRIIVTLTLVSAAIGCNALPDDGDERVDRNIARMDSNGDTGSGAGEAEQQRLAKQRESYLNAKYSNERGQSFSRRDTLYAAIKDVWSTAMGDPWPPKDGMYTGPWANEYVTGLYEGKYGETYYFKPKKGEWSDDCNCFLTNLHQSDFPPRPELNGIWGSVHNHIKGRGPESPIDGQGLNQVAVWVVTSDRQIWVYPPKAHSAKPFGSIDEKGNIVTAYNNLDDAVNPDYDAYAADSGSSCGFWCWVAVAVGVTSGGSGAGIAIGTASSTSSPGCCYGPPVSAPPDSDPPTICRSPDGNGDCT
jgi:hypothetical protein